MAEAENFQQGEGKYELNDYVAVKVEEDTRTVHGIITAKGTDLNGNLVENTWNLTIPGWDTLHGNIDPETKKPMGGHIYGVRPIACSVPEGHLKHAKIPKVLNVYSEGAKKERVNGDYNLVESWGPENDVKRPMWLKEDDDGRRVVIVHKKQKGKPAWIITQESLVKKNQDGGYALFAQDLWLPSDRENHLRGEVWGIWDPAASRWKADQSLFVTNGAGTKPELMAKFKKELENAGK